MINAMHELRELWRFVAKLRSFAGAHGPDDYRIEMTAALVIVTRINDLVSAITPWPVGVPCDHPECFSHVTRPCERCGRCQGRPPISRDLMKTLLGGTWPDGGGFVFDAVDHFRIESNGSIQGYDAGDPVGPALRITAETVQSLLTDCAGKGKCHAAVQWCASCGDVSQVCDAAEDDCHCHTRCEHCERLHSIDYECEESRTPVRTGTHFDEDTIPHGNCNDPISCDCECLECMRAWVESGKLGRPKGRR